MEQIAASINAALNVIQVCILAWIAAKYGRSSNGSGSPPKV